MIFQDTDSQEGCGAQRVMTREEVAEADTWDLTRLYAGDEDWEKDLLKYQNRYPEYASFRGTLGESASALLECLEFDKEMDLLAERLGHYASLRTSEDGANNNYLTREARLHHVLMLAAEVASFLTPEIQEIEREKFDAFLKEPCLAPWVNRLKKLRRFKQHILSEKEERILAMAWMPLKGHEETFSQLTNVDMTFGLVRDEKGREVELSHGAFSSFLVKREPELRKDAFKKYYEEFSDHRYTLAATLASSIKTDVFSARVRNYSSALEMALFPDYVPVSVYDNLIKTVKANLEPLFGYYGLRKRMLKLDELHFYDTYVPIVESIEVRTSFDDACEKVLAALAPLGEEYVATLREGFKSRWCDRYETKGKRSGAFSSSSYGNPPYIMMNYKEDVFSDVYTLAHEAGHSMHSWYSQREQSFQDYRYPIFLAEVASTFNEELLTHYLLENTDDPKMKAYIINRQVDDIRATLYRQTMFAEFEKLTHQMEESGEALTLENMREVYAGLLKTYHGERMTLDPELDLECLRIPHFYSAFYVYKYATGISAAVALSQRVLEGGSEALSAYLEFLKSGGSRYPIDTLKVAGVDMSTPEPIENTLKLFAQRVHELADLVHHT